MPPCPKCKHPLIPVNTCVSRETLEHRVTGYLCPKCRYYDPLWSAVGLDQNVIGGSGGDERQ